MLSQRWSSLFLRKSLLGVLVLACSCSVATEITPFQLTLRKQVADAEHPDVYRSVLEQQTWDGNRTAVIVCDMWDSHHCYRAVQRVNELAPRMNELLKTARQRGATIIHAPSGCMDAYSDHPARIRATQTNIVELLPKDITQWCYGITAEDDGVYPIDQSDGGEDDTPEEHAKWEAELVRQGRNPGSPWQRQVETLEIDDEIDFISDRGDEIWSILDNGSIENVLMVGVHLNMCVLGRPFGLRRLASNGKNVVLVRDLTDTMYNPASKPFVSHFTGTDLIVRHVERHVCPTITSDQILGGEPLRFRHDQRPRIVMMMGESEYETHRTLPEFALNALGKRYQVIDVQDHPDRPNEFVGIESVKDADLLVISVRRRTLPDHQLSIVRDYVKAGKPVLGIRTASHAFSLRNQEPKEGMDAWPEFDRDVFGGNYTNHHRQKVRSKIAVAEGRGSHPILAGWNQPPFLQGGTLYKVSPLAKKTEVLLNASASGVATEPVAWTYVRKDGGSSFYTSLGHARDFESDSFRRMLQQAVDWLVATNP